MISNSDFVYYASVSKGTMILAEFNSMDADLGTLAAKCLEKTPPFHTILSYTIRRRTYKFLIDDRFVYFAVFDEDLDNSEGLAFLKSVKDAFIEVIESRTIKGLDDLHFHCFQGEFNPVFHQLLVSHSNFEALHSPRAALKHSRSGSLDSPRGSKFGSVPLLRGNKFKGFKGLKKKKKFTMETNGEGEDPLANNRVDISDRGAGLSGEFSVLMQKNGFYAVDSGPQRAKLVWKKHVWVVLSLDLIVCFILFGIWLWICRGFKCIDG